MKFIKKFSSIEEYEAAELSYPATSLVSGTVIYDKEAPAPPTPTFEGKWLATYSDSHTESGECDSSSAITEGEITLSFLVSSVEIGDCVTSIGEYAFTDCSSLTSVTIGNGVTSIGEGAFEGCSGLTSVTIPDNVTSVGSSAFRNCSGLTSVTIGSGVTSIGDYVFEGCSGLTSVTVLATTPPSIGIGAFYSTNDCPIYVPEESVEAYKSAWSDYADRIHYDGEPEEIPSGE